jgi:hypothetical protein
MLPRSALCAVLLVLSPLGPAANAAGKTEKVMVLELRTSNVEPSAGPPVQTAIAQAIAGHAGVEVISAEEVHQLLSLDRTKQLLGCNEDAACVADLTGKLDADLLVNGVLGGVGNSVTLTLSLIRAKQAGSARRETETADSVEALRAAIPGLVARLFGWARAPQATYKLPRMEKGREISFAVFDLKATGVGPEVVQNLTQILSVEIKRIDGTKVVSRDDLMALVAFDKEKQKFGCDDASCLAEIGGALGVQKLLVGSVGKLAETFVINLVLMDVRKNTADNRVTETFKGEDDQLIRATRRAVRELLGVGVAGTGKLVVTASQTGAEVFIDGVKRGIAPASIDGLKPGQHKVRLSRDGFYDWQGDFYVDPLETTSAWAKLFERPAKWYQKWWVWTLAGVAVAGGTVGTVYALQPGDPPTKGLGTVTVK